MNDDDDDTPRLPAIDWFSICVAIVVLQVINGLVAALNLGLRLGGY